MSRSRMYLKDFHAQLRPIEYALLVHYSETYKLPRQEILRRIIGKFADRDKALDLKEFSRLVNGKVMEELEEPELRDQLKQQLKEFVEERGKADAPTATGSTRTGKK